MSWLRRLGSVRLRALLALGAVGVVGATGTTFAAWTDSATIGGTTVTAGTVDLRLNGSDSVTGYTALNAGAMVPGSSVAAVVTVQNSGTAPLRYTATSSATGSSGLVGALTVTVTGAASVTGTAPAASCGGTALPGAGTTVGGTLIGTGRLLAPSTSETVCVQLTLSSTAPSSLQGATANVGLTFTGTTDLG